MLGSEVGTNTACPTTPFIFENWEEISGFTVEANPAAPANCSTFTVLVTPPVVYVKLPACAVGKMYGVVTTFTSGENDCDQVPKIKSLSFLIGPPMLPPKSFNLMMLRFKPRALLLQELAFKLVFRKSSNRRP